MESNRICCPRPSRHHHRLVQCFKVRVHIPQASAHTACKLNHEVASFPLGQNHLSRRCMKMRQPCLRLPLAKWRYPCEVLAVEQIFSSGLEHLASMTPKSCQRPSAKNTCFLRIIGTAIHSWTCQPTNGEEICTYIYIYIYL